MKLRFQLFAPSFVTVILILAGAVQAQADGTVNFGNNNSSLVINGQTSSPVTSGNNVQAALYWSPNDLSSFVQIGAAVTVGIPSPGIFVGGTRTTGAGSPGGSPAQFQVRAWGGGYATYEEALLYNGVLIGQSAVFNNQTGNPVGTPPTPPESLLAGVSWPAGGLQGFTLTPNVVTILPPTITCATNKPVDCTDAWTFDLPTAVDGCTGSNLPVVVISTLTNGQCPAFITCTWAATNSCDTNFAICSQTLLVTCTNCPVLVVTKSCPPYPVPPGGVLAFTGTVTNTSEITVSNVVVVNSQPLPDTAVFGPATLAPGEGAAFAGSYNVAACSCGPHADTLTASGVGVWGATFASSVTASCSGTNHITPGDMNGDGIVDQAELNSVLANYWANSPWIYITNAALLCDGKFQFELTNNTAWNFTVLVTTNLVDWTNLPNPAYPAYQFQDPEGTNPPQRFYRLRWP